MDLGIAVVGPRWAPPRATFITPPDWNPVGESLWCSLNKLAALNHLTGAETRRTFLNEACPDKPMSLSTGREWNEEAIADAIGIDVEDVALNMVSNYTPEHWEGNSAQRYRSSSAWVTLRFCRTCLSSGFHSPLHQLKRIGRCPWHGDPLRDSCPSCGESVDYALGSRLPWHRFACACGHQWPWTQGSIEGLERTHVTIAKGVRAYVERVKRIRCADDFRQSSRYSTGGRPIPNVEHRFVNSLMAVSSFPQNLLVPLYGQEVAAWSGHERQFFDRVPNEIATDVLNGWIVTESLGYDGQRGLSLILDAVNGFRRTKHFIRRTFLDRPQLENVRIHECASIDWAKEKVTIEPNLDCRQIAYVIWLSTLPMFVPIEERLDVSRSPWSFGFSRETFLQYWLDLAASIIVNSGLDMTLRLPIARWLLSKSLPIDLIHRYLSWLRFCAEKYCRDTYKFDDWKLGRFGLGNQLLVAASEKNPPALFRFAEARLEGAVRRAITTTPRSRNEPMSTEERANHVFSAMTTSSFRL